MVAFWLSKRFDYFSTPKSDNVYKVSNGDLKAFDS